MTPLLVLRWGQRLCNFDKRHKTKQVSGKTAPVAQDHILSFRPFLNTTTVPYCNRSSAVLAPSTIHTKPRCLVGLALCYCCTPHYTILPASWPLFAVISGCGWGRQALQDLP